ncbi:class I SAM-dependent methyltransferase [Vulcanococcus limneticus]|uniref:class I SAM-dependent methyltransferase n=1 Tax=Vulcanococcus limneticus TaxID=2170428 RepID=UPI00398C1BE0
MARSLAGLMLRCGFAVEDGPRRRMLTNLRHTRARYGDITRGLSLPSGSVRQLYASHVIEHLPLAATRQALRECHRLLAPDGLFRLVVPDLRHLVERYIQSTNEAHDPESAIRFCLESGLGSAGWGPLWSRLRGDRHHLMHDTASLGFLLQEAGFSQVRRARCGDSSLDFSAVEDLERWCETETIGFECRL